MVSVVYHSDLNRVQSDEQLARLLSSPLQAAPFDRLAWWQDLAERCGLAGGLAVAKDGTECAVLALAGDGAHLTSLSNWYTFRYRPVMTGAAAPLVALAQGLKARARRITLEAVPDEDGSADRVVGAFRAAGWIVFQEPSDINHYLQVSNRTYEEYLAGRPGPLRTTLKRKRNRVSTVVLDRFDEDAWAAYEAIYADSWKPAEGSPAFLRTFAVAESREGRLRLGLARDAEDRPVAAQLWTIEGDTAYIHKLAHREDARALSPGSVLLEAMLRRAIDVDKVACVDFGTGDDAYKRDWMELSRPRYRIDMFRPLAPGNWPALARAGMRLLAANGKQG